MAPLDLEGGTLGQRHEHYNKLLKEAISSGQPVAAFTLGDNDIENLLKIDQACHARDVDFIVSVFKCGDMLCVSRALARSPWLVTDPQYANIINSNYVHTELFPYMNTKAFIKLIKQIRLNIQDEVRAEQFYLYEKKDTDALKWLPKCSASFIEANIEKHINNLKIRTYKRLCEKTDKIFEIVLEKTYYYERARYAQVAMFLLKADVDKFLDVIEKDRSNYIPKFNDKGTTLIMKKSPKRVIDKFDRYASSIHVPTFCKYLKADEIKPFLYAQAKKDNDSNYEYYNLRNFFRYDTLKYFVKKLPKNEQFEFVKKIFIDKEIADADEEKLVAGTEQYNMRKLYVLVRTPSYIWYRFADFERAFQDITEIISKDLDNHNIVSMLTVLMSCAENNLQHIQKLIQYYLDKHRTLQSHYTLKFTTDLLDRTNIYQYDEKTWNLINELFKILKIYDEPDNVWSNTVAIIESVVVYKILHDQIVPENIQKKFSFKTLKEHGKKLNKEQKEKVFRYLYEFLINKCKPITTEQEFGDTITILSQIFELLRDWKKELTDFTLVTDKIKECVKVKSENSWKGSLLQLYKFKKSWQRHMFEESVIMNPCEEVCLNALKHDPLLLERQSNDVQSLRCNDAVSLRRLLAKLRIYWPQSLATQWVDAYMENLNKTDGHKATIRGLCTSLSQKQVLELIDKYKPNQAKIDWSAVDDRILSIQRFIAKNMHIARPQPVPESILFFARGDYLQYALPSLLAIFYNLSIMESKKYIPKLLDAPVSVQKHGIRLAYKKLDHETLKKIFFDCWKASKNVSIRAIIFQFTFELLCNQKDSGNAVGLWELTELFIDNLTFEEDKKIYELMSRVEQVPRHVRAKYLVKTYDFMKKLTQKVKEEDRDNYKRLTAQLAEYSRQIMEDIPPEFIKDLIQEFVDKDFFGFEDNFGSVHGIISVISAYILTAKNENLQAEKYEKVFVPIMKRAFEKWSEKKDGSFIIRSNFQCLLSQLSDDLRDFVVENKLLWPIKMFLDIKRELEKSISISENYMMLTKWKLTATIAQLAEKPYSEDKNWADITAEIAPEFGKICLDYLKEDVKTHFPCIYRLYSKALNTQLQLISEESNKIIIYKCFLAENDFIEGYLTAIETSKDAYSYNKDTYADLWNQISEHPSVEIKMHYYYNSKNDYDGCCY
ncbi:uncharacterized protein LOC111359991 [Spodoptera litura]|uniref:Uncharacterized protein LOC111359991 n=1 Tax=Spodoptera litura TaxID=69820 RepID=A0A9J7EIJ2_SPOLT|nr:uncharacterized protein LOC111359991 [Spodoptera litura]XP_022831521.1 uncharacterized protein LOC111359991 [Spodoptera litura]